MDMNHLNLLSDEQKAEYMETSRVFAEPGWKRLVKFYEEKVDAMLTSGANATSWEDNRVAYGLRLAYEEFIALEDTLESYFSSISDAVTEAQQAAEEDDYE
jgi:hypothetical protein